MTEGTSLHSRGLLHWGSIWNQVQKNYNIRISRNLSRRKAEQIVEISLKHFVADKFRKPILKEALLQGDLESIAKALTGKRLPYAYMIWEEPKVQ
jgi:hypothetical protein